MEGSNSGAVEGEERKEVDIYRDTPIRLLGYANEVGEAFRSLVHVNVVRLSYVVASSYVLADTFDKSSKVHNKEWSSPELRRRQVAVTAVDTLVWQALASVIVPGFTINRLCFFTGRLLLKTTKLPRPLQKWTTTAIGLSAIPFIVHPIDTGIHLLLDKTLRPWCNIPTHLDGKTPEL